mgnify:CR=1 FL=1
MKNPVGKKVWWVDGVVTTPPLASGQVVMATDQGFRIDREGGLEVNLSNPDCIYETETEALEDLLERLTLLRLDVEQLLESTKRGEIEEEDDGSVRFSPTG